MAAGGLVITPETYDLPRGERTLPLPAGDTFPQRHQPFGDWVIFIPSTASRVTGEVKESVEQSKVLPPGSGGQPPLPQTIPPRHDGNKSRIAAVYICAFGKEADKV